MFYEFPATFVATKEVGETKGKNYIYILLFSMKFPTEKQRANYVWTFLNRTNNASQYFNATIMKVQPWMVVLGSNYPISSDISKEMLKKWSERQPGDVSDCQTISAVGQMLSVYGKFLQMYNLCGLGWNWSDLRVFGFHKIHKWPDHFYLKVYLWFCHLYP